MKLKNFAWNIFEETGDPEAYLLYKELSEFEEYAAEEDYGGLCQNLWGGDQAE